MSGTLQGIRILECAGYLSAPTAGYMLGDLGAEVIKVEDRVRGDPTRGIFEIFGQGTAARSGINVLFETAKKKANIFCINWCRHQIFFLLTTPIPLLPI
jgi:crotonobetainyl-CoA:carnitine CoA-transferase CaiB-like acyl-CoA transferase